MKQFIVTIGCVSGGSVMRATICARNSDAAWKKAVNKFVDRYPQVLERRLSFGGAVVEERL